jgi:prephenate dehydrogenase
MAARLADASDGALSLAGQGLRDVTRIAVGRHRAVDPDPGGQRGPGRGRARRGGGRPGGGGRGPGGHRPAGSPGGPDLKVLAALLEQGGAGVARIPGKRGGPARAEAAVQVVIPDRPGELARLFQAAGEAGVNIEDIGIEHSPGLPVGVAELTVHPEAVGRLTEALAANGWPVRR